MVARKIPDNYPEVVQCWWQLKGDLHSPKQLQEEQTGKNCSRIMRLLAAPRSLKKIIGKPLVIHFVWTKVLWFDLNKKWRLTTKPDLPLEVAVSKSRFLKINLKVKKTQIRVRRRVELEGTNDLPACAASWRGTWFDSIPLMMGRSDLDSRLPVGGREWNE